MAEPQFDIFVESVINRPWLKGDPEWYRFFGIDFHWAPQNFICDAYKFIDRYKIYRAENVSDRKQFLMDIGGEKLWDEVGSHGWFKRGTRDNQTWLIKAHRGEDKAEYIKASPFFEKLTRDYVNATKDWRKNEPEFNHWHTISEVNVSLLETSATFHSSHANTKIYKYFRADLLAKALAFYEDDYTLFKLNIPDVVCDFLKMHELSKLMDSVIKYYGKNTKKVSKKSKKKKRKKFIKTAQDIFYGNNSIYGPATDRNRGHKVIHTVDDKNESIKVSWNRDDWIFKYNKDTKIPGFYQMKDFDDEYGRHKLFGVSLSGIRGMMTLINFISFIDPRTWPQNGTCFNLQSNGGDVDGIIEKNIRDIAHLLQKYFNRLLPILFEHVEDEDKKGIIAELKKWTGHNLSKTLLGNKKMNDLISTWTEQDKWLYNNIRGWVLYLRDVPRNQYMIHYKWEYPDPY